jgi:hypothetical protein
MDRPPLAGAVLKEDFLGGQQRPHTLRTLQNAHIFPPSEIEVSKITNRLYALRT